MKKIIKLALPVLISTFGASNFGHSQNPGPLFVLPPLANSIHEMDFALKVDDVDGYFGTAGTITSIQRPKDGELKFIIKGTSSDGSACTITASFEYLPPPPHFLGRGSLGFKNVDKMEGCGLQLEALRAAAPPPGNVLPPLARSINEISAVLSAPDVDKDIGITGRFRGVRRTAANESGAYTVEATDSGGDACKEVVQLKVKHHRNHQPDTTDVKVDKTNSTCDDD